MLVDNAGKLTIATIVDELPSYASQGEIIFFRKTNSLMIFDTKWKPIDVSGHSYDISFYSPHSPNCDATILKNVIVRPLSISANFAGSVFICESELQFYKNDVQFGSYKNKTPISKSISFDIGDVLSVQFIKSKPQPEQLIFTILTDLS